MQENLTQGLQVPFNASHDQGRSDLKIVSQK